MAQVLVLRHNYFKQGLLMNTNTIPDTCRNTNIKSPADR